MPSQPERKPRFFGASIRYRQLVVALLFMTGSFLWAQPSNDDFVNAIDLTSLYDGCSADATYTTVGGTPDRVAGSNWNNGGPRHNVWFKFIAPATAAMNVTIDIDGIKGSQSNTQVAIWEYDPMGDILSEIVSERYIDQFDDIVIGSPYLIAPAPIFYYISVDVLDTASAGTFTICLDDTIDYDYLEGAIDVDPLFNSCSADAMFTTEGATPDLNEGSSSPNLDPIHNRWFRFVAPASGSVNITVETGGVKGTQLGTELNLWQEDGISELFSVSVSGTGNPVIGATGLEAGKIHYISVDVRDAASRGTFTLCLTSGASSDLRISKDIDNPNLVVGSTYVFTVRVENSGPADMPAGTIVNDDLENGFTYVSDNGGGAYNSTTGDWTLPAILFNDFVELEMTVTANASGSYRNNATITSTPLFDPNLANNTISRVVSPPAGGGSDNDGDLIVDRFDLDDDNDGIQDHLECQNSINSRSSGGALSSSIQWLEFDGAAFSDLTFDSGDSQSFTSANGDVLTLTVTSASSSAVINTPIFNPFAFYLNGYILNTTTSIFSNTGNAIYTISFSAVDSGGAPIAANIVTTDAEESDMATESLQFETDGSPWSILENLVTNNNINYQATGEGSSIFNLTGTNTGTLGTPLILSNGLTSLTLRQSSSSGSQSFILGWLVDPVPCVDTDNDGVVNSLDFDSDNDGIYDAVEAGHGAAHTNGEVDGASGSDGIPNAVQAGPESGNVNYGVRESSDDVDTIYDFLDLDSDGDGIPDNVEAQPTIGYIFQNPDNSTNYMTNRGVNSAYLGGLDPVNSDADARADYRDIDSDDEGGDDRVEAALTLTGLDDDNDGLDNATDATVGYDNPGGTVESMLSGPVQFPDTDGDVSSGGDVDFRDDMNNGTDPDGDMVFGAADLDSDNDGIPDTAEDLNNDGDNDPSTDISDADNDGVANYLDLDSDNDGIYDVVEAGNNIGHTDGRLTGSVGTDGIPDSVQDSPNNGAINYPLSDFDTNLVLDAYEIDSDKDGCRDVIEAGFDDQNGDGKLDDAPLTIDANGVVTSGTNGYTPPRNGNGSPFLDYVEFGTAPNITLQPINTQTCNGGNAEFSAAADDATNYIWQLFNGVSWQTLSDGGIYSDTNTQTLTITGATAADDGNQYRTVIVNAAYICQFTFSDSATLSVGDVPDVSVGDHEVVEGTGIIFPVTLSEPYCSTIDLLLTFDFSDIGTSVPDFDHTPVQVRFVAGQTTAAVVVPTNSDVVAELNETFTVSIVSVDAGSVGDTSAIATGTILDDDRIDSDGDDTADVIDLDDDNDGILDIIECGEPPTYTNQDFEDGINPPAAVIQEGTPPYYLFDESDVPGWETTATGNLIEIWESGHNGVTSYTGNHHAELNADEESALFQTYNSTPGQFTSVSFAHRGRAGVDVVEIFHGPPGGPFASIGRYATDNSAWQVYNTWFIVPAGQTVTQIRFEAIATATGNNRVGNLLDAIYIYEGCHDWDNDGILSNLDLDSDNDGIYDAVEARHGNPHTNGVVDGPAGDNGVPDVVETSPDSDAVNYTVAESLDDADTLQDYVDLDSDGDGIPDNVEAQTTVGYIAPNIDAAADYLMNNGVNSAYLGGLIPENTDGASSPDYLDLDSDNEGGSDTLEAMISLSGNDIDADGLDDATDADTSGYSDPGGTIDNILAAPIILPDMDSDAAAGGDVDFRDSTDDSVTPDEDGDGIPNTDEDDNTDGDNDPTTNPTDTDDDGVPNYLDIDTDNDGIYDAIEAGHGASHTNGIVDGPRGTDGIPDAVQDPGQENSGVVNYTVAESIDDSDTIPDFLDLDSDGDGIPDNVEAQTTVGYVAPNADDAATYLANNGMNSAYSGGLTPVNTDGTDNLDYLDKDSDNEGANDATEARIFPSGTDTDGDGLDDATDADNSGYDDPGGIIDNPLANPFQLIDSDNDASTGGDVDFRDALDNRPDSDNDGVADAVDYDDDNDGIMDIDEGCGNLIVNGSFEQQDFTDAIEFPNGFTSANGTFIGNTYNTNTLTGWDYTQNLDGWIDSASFPPRSYADANHGAQYVDIIGNNNVTGGVSNILSQTVTLTPGESYTFSFFWGEDVGHQAGESFFLDMDIIDGNASVILDETLNAVAEGNINNVLGPKTWLHVERTFTATTDAITFQFTTTPIARNIAVGAIIDNVVLVHSAVSDCRDTDNDGVGDAFDLDSDNDGIYDAVEAGHGQAHTNGIVNGAVGSDGIPDSVQEPGKEDRTGTGYSLAENADDIDSIYNFLDLDSDGDGIPDNIEAQTTTGYIAPNTDNAATYLANDGVNSAYLGGLTPVNTESADNPDYLDLDSDNEGANDTVEAAITLSGNDIDTDGLDDAVDSDTSGYADAGGTIDNPLNAPLVLPDTDGDALTGGDVDFRDTLDDRPDSDLDGVADAVDMDDDNDGIRDIEECLGVNPSMLMYTVGSGQTITNAEYGLSVTSTGHPITGVGPNGIAMEEDAPGHEFTFTEPVERLSLTFGNVHVDNEIGNFQLTLVDGTVVSNADFSVTNDAVEDVFDFQAREDSGDTHYASHLVKRVGAPYPAGIRFIDKSTGAGQSWGIVLFEGYELNPIVSVSFTQLTGPNLNMVGGIAALRPVDCDTDGDGVFNNFDLDSDNDGILDAEEAGHGQAYTNGEVNGTVGLDGIPDAVQALPDDRSVNYTLAESADDADLIYDFIDLDADGDGIPDNVEAQTTIGYVTPNADDAVTYLANDGVNSAYLGGLTPTNSDSTDTPDYLDLDSDNEGDNDTLEANISLSGNDIDADGLDDATDEDTSGYADAGGTIDNPLNAPLLLPDTDGDALTGGDVDFRDILDDRPDSDLDGVADAVDMDDDNDGILDRDEGCGNLIINGSFEQDDFTDASAFPGGNTSSNGTFMGNNLNTNSLSGWNYTENLDGWVNGGTFGPDTFAPTPHGIQFIDVVGNANLSGGIPNVLSQTVTTIPGVSYTISFLWGEDIGHAAGQSVILDLDIIDGASTSILDESFTTMAQGPSGGFVGPRPWLSVERTFIATTTSTEIQFTAQLGGNMLSGASLDNVVLVHTNQNDCDDADADGVPNAMDLDSDNDGILDAEEAGHDQAHTNGEVNGTVGSDGIPDAVQALPNGETTNYTLAESGDDTDTIYNFLDLDSDGDGIPDNVEAQTTVGYVAPNTDDAATYLANDGVNSAYLGGFTPTNTDATDTPDYLDLDSDNEGSNDTMEANISLSGNDIDTDGLDDATDADTSGYADPSGTIDNPLTAPVILPDVDADATSGGDVDFRDALDDRPDNDNDGIADAVDYDDDNDGIMDIDEGCGNLIVNGSFEQQDFTDAIEFPNGFTSANGTFIGNTYNTNTLTGWDYTQNLDGWIETASFPPRTYADANHGAQYVDIIGNNNVTGGVSNILSQTVTLTPGESYTFSFFWGEDVGHQAGESFFLDMDIIDGNGSAILDETLTAVAQGNINNVLGPKTWLYVERTFTATTDAITFQFTTIPIARNIAVGATIDNVVLVNTVPSDCRDTDNDGVIDAFDLDSDNDGIYDAVEAGHGAPHTNGVVDGAEGTDGIPDSVQEPGKEDRTGIGYAVAESTNDIDTIPDFLDLDSDGDGISDNVEAQTTIGYVAPNADNAATYATNDGVNSAYLSGLNPTNTDATDTPDYLDLDSDNEGDNDTLEANITLSGNDIDADGLDDATDADTSGYADAGGTIDNPLNAPLLLPDTDGDALTGGDVDFRDPVDDRSMPDEDGDGIPNTDEDDNTDGDNDPTTDPTDTDGDGVPNYLDLDTDNDGIYDAVEAGHGAPHTNGVVDGPRGTDGIPDAVQGPGQEDSGVVNYVVAESTDDTDTIPDFLDLDSDGDGIPDNVEAQTTLGYIISNPDDAATYLANNGINSAYLGGLTPVNSDIDDIPDYLDLNSDQNGADDTTEGGLVLTGLDSDNDGLDNAVDATADYSVPGGTINDPIVGAIQLPDFDGDVALVDGDVDYRDPIDDTTDTDLDGIVDFVDLDDDNDGILDVIECGNPPTYFNQGFEEGIIPANANFVSPAIPTYYLFDQSNVPAWETTAPDGQIEIWASGHNGVASHSGNYHAEINAVFDAALFQSYNSTPGEFTSITFAHRGRTGVDVIEIFQGPPGGPYLSMGQFATGQEWTVYKTWFIVPPGQTTSEIRFEAISTSTGDRREGNLLDSIYIYEGCTETDGDGVDDGVDLDSDNDGIYDAVEAGHGAPHTNGEVDGPVGTDGIPDAVQMTGMEDGGAVTHIELDSDSDGINDHVELDSDDDGCNDVNEAGYTDDDANGLLGTAPETVNANGLVTSGTDGYTEPQDLDTNGIYEYREVGSTAIITDQPAPVSICEGTNAVFDITATNADVFQWQFFDGTNWVDLTNTGVYSGTDTDTLTIAATVSENGTRYRVLVSNVTYSCEEISSEALLMVGASPTLTIGDASVTEGTDMIVPITLSGPACLNQDITLTFNFTNGTAEDTDYTNTPIQVTIPSGQTTVDLIIPTTDDTIDEPDEDFTISVASVDTGTLSDSSDTATGTIIDDDAVVDLDSDNDGILDSFEDLNADGDNDPATNPTNSDNDIYPDYLDIDSDNDGIPDNVEAQTTAGYIPPSLEDLNANGLDDAYEDGTTIGLIPVNTDGADLPDYLDEDSDNDNVPDAIEGNDQDHDGIPDVVLIGSDKDDDGLDDSFEGEEQIDIDVNDEIDDPLNDLPNTDGDNEPDYRDTDDDDDEIPTIDEDINGDGDYANDDTDNDGTPDYLDPDQPPVIEDVEVFNVVTPNGDGAHDYLIITGLDVRTNNNISIYNRWGVLVYTTESYDTNGNTFDGTSQARATYSSGDKLPVGTYFYILNYEDLDEENKTLSGHLYLN